MNTSLSKTQEVKKLLRASLIDEKGKHLGVVNVFQKDSNAFLKVWLRNMGLHEHISAWLVAGPNEHVTMNNWSKVGNMSSIKIGHDESTKHVNLFRQKLGFIPASGDMVVIAIDDCNLGHCKPTMNHIATATLK